MKKTLLALMCLALASLAQATTFEEATKGAQQGDPAAEHALASMLLYGQGVPKDAAKAIEWLGKR